jgi:hemoglobin-like flavoprotein
VDTLCLLCRIELQPVMGSGNSRSTTIQSIMSIASIDCYRYPLYYDPDEVTAKDVELTIQSLHMIQENSPSSVVDTNTVSATASDYFWKLLFMRLKDQNEPAIKIFEDNGHHSKKFLVRLLEMAWSLSSDTEKFKSAVSDFAIVNCRFGIPPEDYGAVGDALFWTLGSILGPKIYDWRMERAWIRLYSSILTILIPIVTKLDSAASPTALGSVGNHSVSNIVQSI